MQPDVTIRPLTGTDASEYQILRLRALKEHPEAFGQSYETQKAMSLDAVAARIGGQSGDDFMLGLYLEEKLSGTVRFARGQGEKEQHKGGIYGMYVASEAQGNGYGRALIIEALEIAKQIQGLEQISLAVVTINAEARNLYLSLGFESYGIERRAAYVNGEYLDDDLMVLFLDN